MTDSPFKSPGLQDIHDSVFVHPTAQIYGKVTIGEGSSVWPYVVMRSENDHIRIGRRTNIQDHVMIHIGASDPVEIGDFCSITHKVVVHGARIGDNCLIGIGAILMDGAEVGEGSIVAGGAFIPDNKSYPPNSIIMGAPARAVAERDVVAANRLNAWMYWYNAQAYAEGNHRSWDEALRNGWMDEIKARIAAGTDDI